MKVRSDDEVVFIAIAAIDAGRGDSTLIIMEVQKLWGLWGPKQRPLEECHQAHTRPLLMWIIWRLTSAALSI